MEQVKDNSGRQHREYAELNRQIQDIWQVNDGFEPDDRDVLVIPSFSVDQRVVQKVAGFLHYEERLLFSLIRLRNPKNRLIYVTAQPLSPIIIEYYLQLLPGIPFSHARDRLLLLSTYDHSAKPLTQKILERPRLIERIREALRPNKSYMVCFNATQLEEELSQQLGIPLFAASPALQYWGSKSGSREIFAECQVAHPDGSPLEWTGEKVIEQAARLWHRNPSLQRIVVKLNEGLSGEGNAVLDLRPLAAWVTPETPVSERQALLVKQFEFLSFQSDDETWASFASRIPELGAIVEAFIEGEQKRSPSVQGYISPLGQVSILSTHDQILGGPDGQVYLGCRFPADESYRLALQEIGLVVGEALARRGAMERYGVDFVAVRQETKGKETWDLQAIEINLRKGGTTHPFMTLKFLTNGCYDTQTGLFFSQQNIPKYYIASDNLQKDRYCGLLAPDLMDIMVKHRLHFDSNTQTGTVFHLMGALSEFGKLGLTCIGNSLEDAETQYERVEAVLDEETDLHLDLSSPNEALARPIRWQ